MPDASKSSLPAKINKEPDRGVKHGVHSWLRSKRGASDRASRATIREVGKLMEELEAEHTADGAIPPGAKVLIAGTAESVGVVRLIGNYLRKYGVLDQRSVKQVQMELSPPITRSWLANQNTIRQNVMALEALKASRGQHHEGPTLEAIRAEYEVQAESVASQNGVGSAQGGQPEACQDKREAGEPDGLSQAPEGGDDVAA